MNCGNHPGVLRKAAVLLLLVVVVTTSAFAQKSKKAMTKPQVLELHQNGVPSNRNEELVRAYGIAFEVTTAVVLEFQDAGARDDLIRTLRDISPKPEPAPPASKPEPAAQPAAAP